MNKENEHPPVTMISIQPQANSEQHFGSSNGGNEFYGPTSAKPVTFGNNGAIHAPRHSFTKRSFGRDLMNIP